MSTAASSDPALSVEVATSQVGSLGTDGVGLGGVFIDPLRANIIVWNRMPGVQWESAQDVRVGQSVFAGNAWYRVRAIEPPAGPQHGRIIFDPMTSGQAQTMDPGAVVLADGGRLRVDGPGIETAHDVRVVRWLPDPAQPVAAEIEIWPAMYERDSASPETVGHLELKAGIHSRLGHTEASVLSLQGATAEHPAWIVLRLPRQD